MTFCGPFHATFGFASLTSPKDDCWQPLTYTERFANLACALPLRRSRPLLMTSMPIHPPLTSGARTQASTLRRQADDLLQRLMADRETSEQRLAVSGKRDPLKTVTGSTAIERAIQDTRGMIAEMDLMLAGIEGGAAADARESAPVPVMRPASPLRPRSGGMLFGKRPVAASA
jgi:hypothetical protein